MKNKNLSESENTMRGSSIIFRDVKKTFEDQGVLCNICLEVAPEESLVIMGQSGVGKSVLLKCLLRLIRQDAGLAEFSENIRGDGSLKRSQDWAEHIGVVFQSSALFDGMTVWENVAFRLLRECSRKKARDIALENLRAVGLSENVADLYPSALSGGMQRRVAVARAIATRPRYLFFDEPTAGLDPIFSAKISALIRKCITELRATVITITHDIQSALIVADTIAMLHEGVIIWKGPAHALKTCDHPVVRQFLIGNIQQ